MTSLEFGGLRHKTYKLEQQFYPDFSFHDIENYLETVIRILNWYRFYEKYNSKRI